MIRVRPVPILREHLVIGQTLEIKRLLSRSDHDLGIRTSFGLLLELKPSAERNPYKLPRIAVGTWYPARNYLLVERFCQELRSLLAANAKDLNGGRDVNERLPVITIELRQPIHVLHNGPHLQSRASYYVDR